MSSSTKSRRPLLVVDGFAPVPTVLEHCVVGVVVTRAESSAHEGREEQVALVRDDPEGWRLLARGEARFVAPSELIAAVHEAFGAHAPAVQIPETRLRVPGEVASAALELARRWELTTAEVWLLIAATRAPRARELAKHFGLALRTIEGRSAEIRSKSGVAVRDLVLEVLWVALGDART
jgi:hypothetical protein